MAAETEKYLSVLKASYDYDPQPDAEDEIPIKENQLLFLLERTDADWWRVKPKSDLQEEEGHPGLVPAAYVELAVPIQVVKAIYDYDAAQPTELTVKEDEILHVYDKDDDWLLVQAKRSEEGRVGYVPGNYVEEVSGDGEVEDDADHAAPPAPSLSSIVVPDSPPKPPRPVSTYVDPADLVAATSNKAQADAIQTWSVSEVDAKGKKKKGTLGIGNGAMFFASESDKNPVRKWQMSDIQGVRIEKSKHVHIDVGGPEAANLHFHAGSKDTAEAIRSKLESSRALVTTNGPPATNGAALPSFEDRPRLREQKSVHFAQDEPDVIPPSETYGAEEEEEEEVQPQPQVQAPVHAPLSVPPPPPARVASPDGPAAVVLYNFSADGDDELTVAEGETLIVLEKDSDEWWKVRNASGAEGVVPASYVELVDGGSAPPPTSRPPPALGQSAAAAAAAAAAERAAREAAAREEEEEEEEAERRAAAEREQAERQAEKERRKQEAEQRAKVAAAAADVDRQRREREREKREKEKEKERAAAEEDVKRRKQAEQQRAAERRKSTAQGRSSVEDRERRGPPSEALREWHDRTGQFRVDAAFLGFANGKLRLHKINGVVIEVPAEKMSEEDLRYVQKITKQRRGQSSHRRSDDDDEMPLELIKQGLSEKASTPPKKPPPQQPKKGPTIDWFEFFLGAGCDVDDCTRYASSFERDKIDEAILPDITESTMRSLGLREGDIIRVKKAIEQRKPKTNDAQEEQLRKDEELARQLQAEESGSNLKTRSPAPNLFAGSNGELKNMRRGRPQPSKSLPPATVDLKSISTASDQIHRGSSPMIASPDVGSSPTSLPPKSTAAVPPPSGFDDDAWTNRPSSTKPVTPAPSNPVPRAASVPLAPPSAPTPPPAPAQPAPTHAAAPAVTVSPPARAASIASGAPVQQAEAAPAAQGGDNDIFNQLARIASLRVNSPAAPQPTMAVAQTVSQRAPSVSISPPAGFQTGMGMGTSPVPMGTVLQAQQTGMLPPANGPRGPFAPVPANQSLLQPLVPTTTGFGGFVPTRPGTAPIPSSSFHAQSPFQSAPPPVPSLLPQQTGFAHSVGFQPQPTGFQSQPTGFQPQPTGFQSQMSQPTRMPNGGFGGVGGGLPSFQSTPSFGSMQTNPTGFNPMQSNPTGFGPGFGQQPLGINSGYSSPAPPPPPPPPPQPAVNTNPANIFASMKSGTFAQEDSTPQLADKYDSLRPNPAPLAMQQTGWGTFGGANGNGFQSGFGYQR